MAPVTLAEQEFFTLVQAGSFDAAHAVGEEIIAAHVWAESQVPTAVLAQMAQVALERESWTRAEGWAMANLQRGFSVEMHYVLAEAYIGLNLTEWAESVLRLLPEDQQSTAETQRRLGDVYLAQRRPTPALAAYESALALQPMADAAQFGRALALQSLGRTEEMIEAYRQLGPIETMDYVALRMQAVDLLESGLYEVAEERLLALADRPGCQQFLRPSLRAMLARAQHAQRHFGPAAANYRRYLKRRPEDASANIQLQRIERRQQISYLPALERLEWLGGGEAIDVEGRCMISMEPYRELTEPVLLKQGRGRYLFEYQQLEAYHDRSLRGLFGDQPLDGSQVFRLPPYEKTAWERAVDGGWVPWRRPLP